MSSSALKITAAVMVLLAVVLGGFTFQAYRQNSESAQQAAAKEAEAQKSPQMLAVVANKPLPAYKAIDRADIALVPVAVAPQGYYTNIDDVVAKMPLVDVDAGSALTPRYFKEGNVLARAIPAGYQAVSVEINDVIAVGGFLRPGDIVDVLVFVRNGAGVEQPQSRVLLSGVRLLAYEERIIDRPEGVKEDDAQQQQRRQHTAVLAVPAADTTKLSLGAGMGDLRLALHSQADVAQAAEIAATAETAGAAKAPVEAASDKAVTAAELTSGGSVHKKKDGPAPPTVEVYRGSQRERVVTRN